MTLELLGKTQQGLLYINDKDNDQIIDNGELYIKNDTEDSNTNETSIKIALQELGISDQVVGKQISPLQQYVETRAQLINDLGDLQKRHNLQNIHEKKVALEDHAKKAGITADADLLQKVKAFFTAQLNDTMEVAFSDASSNGIYDTYVFDRAFVIVDHYGKDYDLTISVEQMQNIYAAFFIYANKNADKGMLKYTDNAIKASQNFLNDFESNYKITSKNSEEVKQIYQTAIDKTFERILKRVEDNMANSKQNPEHIDFYKRESQKDIDYLDTVIEDFGNEYDLSQYKQQIQRIKDEFLN